VVITSSNSLKSSCWSSFKKSNLSWSFSGQLLVRSTNYPSMFEVFVISGMLLYFAMTMTRAKPAT